MLRKKKVKVNLTKIAMRTMILLGIWLLSGARCQQSKTYVAQEGGVAVISCQYDPGYETYPKFFSKGDYGKRETFIRTTDKTPKTWTDNGKYYLFDDTEKRTLHLTINRLSLKDAGTYWCEINAYMFDPKTEIELKVNKAPAPLKPPLVTSGPPVSTTVQAITRKQQSERTTVTERASSTTVEFTQAADVHAVLPLLAGKKLYLFVAAAALLLLSLLMFLFFHMRKHRHDTAGQDASATIVSQHEENVYSLSSPSTEAGHQHISEDVHLLYSTVCFNTEAAASGQTRPAGPSEVYTTIRHPTTTI